MSRGSRGGGRGRGRGGFGGGALPPMGLSFADIANLSRETAELYPPMNSMPALAPVTEEERKIVQLQEGFAERLRRSKYYLVEKTKSDELPRYSDKYRPTAAAQPTLKRKDLNPEFFPTEIFEDYFNPRRKRGDKKTREKKINLDEIEEDEDKDKENSSERKSDAGSENDASDYDVEEEYDNDYVENYFDNGEGDDLDDLGDDGGGGHGGGDFD